MRIRSIKPEFWRSPDVSELCIEDRLLFVGLWSYVDDNGVGQDRVSTICADLFADDLSRDPRETLARVSEGLERLSEAGRIIRYTVEKRDYLSIVNWEKHQRIDKPNKPRYPAPTSGNAQFRETLAESSRHSREIPAPGTGEQRNRGTEVPPVVPQTGDEPKKPTPRKTRIPDDWQPNDTHRQKAAEQGIDLEAEAEKFRDHAIANGKTFADWSRGFHTWLNNAKRFEPRPGRPPQPPRTFDQIRHDANLDLWEQVKREEEGNAPWPPPALGA